MKGLHWASLNDEGKKLYGDVFPDGEIPIISMIHQWAKLGGSEKPEQVYMIRVSDLTPEQFEKIIEKVMKNLKGSKEEIKAYFEKENIPLRQSLTSGAGTSDSGFMASLVDDYGFEDEETDEDRESDPETCNMGSYSPGTEECDFCASSDYCAEAFHEMLKRVESE